MENKVCIYVECAKGLEKSGVGRAARHQERVLDLMGIPYTRNIHDDFTILHVNTVFLRSYFVAKKAKKQGKPVIYHAHSTVEDFRNSYIGTNLIAPLFGWWIKKCYRLGDRILTPTPYSRQLLLNYGLTNPIVPISNGIDLQFFERNEKAGMDFRTAYGFRPDDKIVVSVGLYLERKGILDFVELAKRMPDVHFVWCGYSDLWTVPAKVRKAVRTDLPNLHFIGFVPQAVLRGAYSTASVFFFPTHEETEGIVLLEALASRTPVLVRDIPIYSEWLTDGVNCYKASTVDEMQQKLDAIINRRLPDLTEAGYAIAEKRDVHKVGELLAEQYRLALEQVKERQEKKQSTASK